MPATQPQIVLEKAHIAPPGAPLVRGCVGRALVGCADERGSLDHGQVCLGGGESEEYQLKARGASLCSCVRVRKG